MGKSKIIKDISNLNVDLEGILTRSLIIANDLENTFVYDWIKGELYGYDDKDSLPNYRKFRGTLKIYYIAGFKKVSGQPITEDLIHEQVRSKIPNYIMEDISSVQNAIKEKEDFEYDLTDFIPFLLISKDYEVMRLVKVIPKNVYQNILAKVKRVVLEFLLEAERKFGNLDNLDLDSSKEEVQSFNKQVNLYIENLIHMGSGNVIENSNIAGNDVNKIEGDMSWKETLI